MMRQAPFSLEALKLRLISNASSPSQDPLLTQDGIHYLLKALAYADAAFSEEIENVLVKAGSLAVPQLIKNLVSDNNNVRSVSAMALIRIGRNAEDALVKGYAKYGKKASNRWVFQFIFQEMGMQLPVAQMVSDNTVVPLERVG